MHMNTVAARKAGDIPGWEPWFYERVGGGLIIKGGIPRLISKGPRKGKKTWDPKESQTVVVTPEEVEREYQRYEAETGKCGECFGDGKVVASAGVSGTTYRECKVCGGSGKAKCVGPGHSSGIDLPVAPAS